jgi:methyltransferase-like protein/SAM-dependent methyltransferase
MTAQLSTSYDEVPYESKPLFSTHPDCLAVAARLRGLAAPPARSCRVLELGCAAGGNLIPMAYALRESRFVGIDLSQRQIVEGQAMCEQLQLANIALHAGSIADVDASWGTFDYIVCHGVYSWVPPAIQERILWICRHLLEPQGVAYISYNTYPGWHLRTIVRDLMKFHTARFDDPQTKVQQARSILEFMARASADLESPLSKVLAEEAESLPKAADYYLYHEHLEDSNQPLYFHQFVSRARAAGLEYLGEAWNHTQVDNLPRDVQEALQAISTDLIDLEQFVDFIRSRTFRRTLLCHQEAQIVQTPDPAVMNPMYLAALARPMSATPDITSELPEKFALDDGTSASTNVPVMKAALVELFRMWPIAMQFDELLSSVCQTLRIAASDRAAAGSLLASFLVRGYVANLVAVHCEPFKFAHQVSERPQASALARLVGRQRVSVPTLRHRLVTLSPAERITLALTDGSRNQSEIAAAASRAASEVSPEVQVQMPSGDWQEVAAHHLRRFAQSSLLEA